MTEAPNLRQQDRGEESIEGSSSNESRTTTVENDKGPKGPLADLLNLEILPSPDTNTTTVESGGSEDYYGSAGEGGAQGGEGQGGQA